MKFNKQINNGTLLIPGGAFKISGFEGGEKVEIHTLDSAVVVLKKQMTTMELIQAMDALHRLATELTVHLARVCGTCDDCEDGCPFDDLEDGMLELPDYLREEAGIPAGAKLCVYVDDEEKTVTIAEAGYDHDLRDVPPYLLEMLGEAGICLGELGEQLMVGNLIYGERTACNGQEEHGDE